MSSPPRASLVEHISCISPDGEHVARGDLGAAGDVLEGVEGGARVVLLEPGRDGVAELDDGRAEGGLGFEEDRAEAGDEAAELGERGEDVGGEAEEERDAEALAVA